MDSKDFENLSRRVGTETTRRGALKVLAGGLGASVLALLRPHASRADDDDFDVNDLPTSLPIVHCRVTLQKCNKDLDCCSGICTNKVELDPAPDPLEIPLPPPLPDAEIPLPDSVEYEHRGVCGCKPKGSTCYVLLEGAFCCSGRCGPDAKCT